MSRRIFGIYFQIILKMALSLLTHEKLKNTSLEFTTLHHKVHSQCLCTGGFKFPNHICVYWLLDQEWLPNYWWCHESCSQAGLLKSDFIWAQRKIFTQWMWKHGGGLLNVWLMGNFKKKEAISQLKSIYLLSCKNLSSLPCLYGTTLFVWHWGSELNSPLGSCTRVCVYLSLSLLNTRWRHALAIWRFLLFCVCLGVCLCVTWLISLVHAAFSCRDGASNTTVNEGESDGSTTSLKSSWPNTWPLALAAWERKQRGLFTVQQPSLWWWW